MKLIIILRYIYKTFIRADDFLVNKEEIINVPKGQAFIVIKVGS